MSETQLEQGIELVGCGGCSLVIRVLYEEDQQEQEPS